MLLTFIKLPLVVKTSRLKPLFCLFMSGRSRQVLLYTEEGIELRKSNEHNTFNRSITVQLSTGLDEQKFSAKKLSIFSYPSVLTYVLGAQKNHFIETVLLSTHNIEFG